jgi:hypothetical protein
VTDPLPRPRGGGQREDKRVKFDQPVEQHWSGQRGQGGSQRWLATGTGGKNVPTGCARPAKSGAQPINAMSSMSDDSYCDPESSCDSNLSDP